MIALQYTPQAEGVTNKTNFNGKVRLAFTKKKKSVTKIKSNNK
jgi:hypothetical protein